MRAAPFTTLAALAALAACAPDTGRPNVLLITIDTLRADHLSCYGYGRETTPHLDALAAEGLRFTHASTPRAKTTPAVASLLSGLYPHDHGVRDLAAPLSRPVPLLQEVLRERGWHTLAIVGNFVLQRERAGLARGFDVWVEDLPDVQGVPPHDAPQRTARSLTDGALELLDGARSPWFLWLHYMDPHGAYAAPEEHRVFRSEHAEPIPTESELPPSALHRRRVADYNVPAEALLDDGRADAAKVRDLYDAEIRYVDAELGRLFDQLRSKGSLDDTLVVVTADHGESLGEHAYWFEHGAYAYEATCRVPLIVRLPGGAIRGARHGDLSLADLAPTILAWLDLPALPPGEGPRGRARTELLTADAASPHPVFLEKVERADLDRAVQIKAVRLGDWKLVRRYTHVARDGARELIVLSDELYDLAADPREEHDLSEQVPATAPLAELRGELLRFAAADEHFPELDEILQRRREALERDDPEALRVLRALGY